MTHKSDLIQIFSERGYIHQATDLDAIDTHAATSIIPTYIGFDCTADSLHVGSLVQIMMLRILQKCGHKPIVLMGGGMCIKRIQISCLMNVATLAENLDEVRFMGH